LSVGQLSAFSYQLSAFGFQLSAIGFVSYQLSAFSYQLPVMSFHQFSHQCQFSGTSFFGFQCQIAEFSQQFPIRLAGDWHAHQ